MKKPTDYDVYLFDFDYTLMDSGDGIAMCFRHVFEAHGYEGISDDAIKKTIGIPLTECFTILLGVTDEKLLEQYTQEFRAYGDIVMAENTPPFPYTEAMLKKLKALGKRTGIISTKHRRRVVETLELCGLDKYIDRVLAIDDVEIPKPDPMGLLQVMNELGGTLETTLYTGDSTIDANTANNAHVDFVAVTTGTTPAEDFLSLPYTRILPDLSTFI